MNICLSCEGVTATAAERCGHCGAFLLPLDSVHYPTRRGEADAGNPLLGSVIDGKYQLEGVLGRGGLGTVFQAEHKGSLMRVAVKLLHPRFSERPEYRRALLPEARRAATVTNERCARVLDVGETADGGTFLAMELVDGDTLDALVRSGPLAPSQAVDILVQVAEALVAIHRAGLVHCDLSPRNVMVSLRHRELVAKVLDFGIARSMSMTAGERLDDGEFAGFANASFSAPEHLAGGEVDPRADLYSLGALGWFLLTGRSPIDDSDPARAARAAVAGELEDWPGVAGVPRVLQRLITQCLALAPDDRPASAAAVLRELQTIRGARRPALARFSVTALALAMVFAVFAFFETQPLFLRSAGSTLVLADTLPEQPLIITSAELARLRLYFGGFAAGDLRLDVAQGDTVLLQAPLRPVVDRAGGQLTLAVAQPEWRSAVESLKESSRDGPVDISFVVPGRAPLGLARLRVDDDPPDLQATMGEPDTDVLTSEAEVHWRASDGVRLKEAAAYVVLERAGEFVFPLSGASGTLAIGRELAQRIDDVGSQRGGAVRIEARDFAGNVRRVDVASFARCDVRAPFVTVVTGPTGRAALPSVGGVVSMRVQLSAAEPDCVLVIRDLENVEHYRGEMSGGVFHDVDIAAEGERSAFDSGIYDFVVEDSVGNQASQQISCTVRDQSVPLQFLGDVPEFSMVEGELVVRTEGSHATLRCSPLFDVVRVAVVSRAGALAADAVTFETLSPGTVRLSFVKLPAGSHQFVIDFEERGNPTGREITKTLALRVLPPSIEVRVAAQASRFLAGLERSGVLEKMVDGTGYHEGAGWAIDPELLRYIGGTLWVGASTGQLLPLALPTASSPGGSFLPGFLPLRGRNVLGVSLRDVLGRPVTVLVGDAKPPQHEVQGRTVDICAEFYWHDQPPELVGEELPVEHGQPARLRLRLPLPYLPADAANLVLGIAQWELPAGSVTAERDGTSVATFELPFEIWRVASQLADRPREDYKEQLERKVPFNLKTPMGRYEDLSLTLRTTRSTLRPVRLTDLEQVPEALGELRLVPVLGPDRAFAEPVPKQAPPRALFRPQVAVAVRNIDDFLLQDREITCGEARAIVDAALARLDGMDLGPLVHSDDPLGIERLRRSALLPAHAFEAPGRAPLTAVNFFQAYTCCRLLGIVIAGDPGLFRLPMGCELELAAFGPEPVTACNGPAAAGKPVSMRAFAAAAKRLERGEVATAEDTRLAGDFVLSAMAVEIGGLDFGVREWVGDLPHIPGNEPLLSEWIDDHEGHLARVMRFASGQAEPPADLASDLRTVGVVRGLALGELDGLLASSGRRLDPASTDVVPGSVPGVLRTEQLRRDGRDLLSRGPDPRLRRVGFRIAGTAKLVARMRGQE